MPKNLVIVESPAKAKTIEGYLGKDFVVKSSFGHIRDLAKGDKAIDKENNFTPKYEVSEDKKKIITDLKKSMKGTEMVWLATDEDREGEAISWHLVEALNLKPENTRRIVFHEITKSAILKAIENPRAVDEDLVNAQQARRILDRIVGFDLSCCYEHSLNSIVTKRDNHDEIGVIERVDTPEEVMALVQMGCCVGSEVEVKHA